MLEVNPALFYLVIAEAALLGTALGLLAYFYARLLGRFMDSKKREKELENQAQKREKELLADAQIQAKKIVDEAYVSAQKVIRESGDFNAHARQMLASELTQVSRKQADNYRALNDLVKGQIVEVVHTISEDIKKGVGAEVENFGTLLRQEVLVQQDLMRKKVDEQYKAVEKEIDIYKAERLKHVDQVSTKIVQDVAVRVLGKTLTIDEHEDLILKSLEQAKKDNVL